MSRTLTRFLRYVVVGVSTFLFDLILLFLSVEIFFIPYVYAAGASFIVAVSVNYALSRRYIFTGTLRSAGGGYVNFFIIAAVGFCAVIGGMYLAVTVYDVHYVAARIAIAAMTGFWNYLMNLFVNFKVAGRHF